MPAAQPVPEPEPKITPQATLQAIEAIFSHLPDGSTPEANVRIVRLSYDIELLRGGEDCVQVGTKVNCDNGFES